ncbi:SOS response-associated peptidase [Brevibacillus laterosporus]|uniref:Abasic site processing protein n=1 Tax=Brevibacillus laterosporus TaxID=1465 RepID=A0A518VCL3_BRELA|nr:SOS response-associated peptidase [Brevibacillus laterosporus]
MCGRFTLFVKPDDLKERYSLEEIPFELIPRYNIAPTQHITAIINDKGRNRIGQLKWGLIPSWSKDEKMAYKMINAKAETIREKPSFKKLFIRKRCIIPADGFYEWKKIDSDKQPMRIMMKDEGIFSLAGLYDTWTSPEGVRINTCTIITTKPNTLMADIHDRMPVIIKREDESLWLNRDVQDGELLESLLLPFDEEQMKAYPVSKMVGNVRNDLPECIAEI